MHPKDRNTLMLLLVISCFHIYIYFRLIMEVLHTESDTRQNISGLKGSYVIGNNEKGDHWIFFLFNNNEYIDKNHQTRVKDRVVYSREYLYVLKHGGSDPQRLSLKIPNFGLEKHLINHTNSRVIEIDIGTETRKRKVTKNFRLEHVIGDGHFGKVYLGTDLNTGKSVAIKERNKLRWETTLQDEYNAYKDLQSGVGIPKVLWYGREGQSEFLVMELLGASLKDRLVSHSGKFSLKTVLLLAEVLVDRLEYIHSKGYVYRDPKPENILTGLGNNSNEIYIIDFGSVKRFRNADTLEHIPYRTNKTFVGSLEFASVNAQLGIQQSRRDDMESLAYVLVYLLRGTLPWLESDYDTVKDKYASTLDQKMAYSMAPICDDCPREFFIFQTICQSMRFDSKPDYSRLRSLFRDVVKRYNYTFDHQFVWEGLSNVRNDGRAGVVTSISPLVRRWRNAT